MSKLVVVVGITGNQGGSVADAFLSDSSWRIRAITRDPSKPSAKEWASRGVELVQGDMDDVASLTKAFTGATAIFAMTDYWFPLSDPKVRAEAEQKGMPPNQLCAELETQRAKNLARAAAAPEVQKTLERYVYSSLPHCSLLSGGKYTKIWHFDSKAVAEKWIREDPEMQKAGLSAKASFVHVGLYTDNWTRSTLEICKAKEGDGYYHLDITDGRAKQPFVWTRRDTGPLVKKLVEDLQPGTRLVAMSESATYREFMAKWAKVGGKTLAGDGGIKQLSEEEYRDALPGDEHIKEHLTQCWQWARDFGYNGGDKDSVFPEDVGMAETMTSLEDYFKQEDWSTFEG
ncbi:uncharacterized protein ALTATR162_LOCUS8653 [Alternaria atra]|jgi:hypothetical protein|uniref:NmrA-like domain-containing protein n=1 Tax=Alternaria atra TaxID=119953 RepID=A0A8J2I638_9PLEO|nr:uncharacterized protein ALTATR162_LOCUS8653 [Alternaria atra]CAG5178344.1 unnamed protein product [Alternaria atra]